MSKLEFPLKDKLRDPGDEHAVSRMWQAIDARFPRQKPQRRTLPLILGPIAAVAAAVVLVVFLRHDAGPLRLAGGGASTCLLYTSDAADEL